VLPCSLCSGLGGVPHRQWSRRAPATAPRTRRACTGRRAPATGSSQSGAAQFQSEVYIRSASLLHFHAEFRGGSRCAFREMAQRYRPTAPSIPPNRAPAPGAPGEHPGLVVAWDTARRPAGGLPGPRIPVRPPWPARYPFEVTGLKHGYRPWDGRRPSGASTRAQGGLYSVRSASVAPRSRSPARST